MKGLRAWASSWRSTLRHGSRFTRSGRTLLRAVADPLTEYVEVKRPNACRCGDCFHPVIGPDVDGDPCDWCQDCGCPSEDHTRMTTVIPPAQTGADS